MKPPDINQVETLYSERLTSPRTTTLFAALALLCAALAAWRFQVDGARFLVWALAFFAMFFLFSALNYRVLRITITPASFRLAFGIFHWKVRMEDVDHADLDSLTFLQRCGGAGVHFMVVGGRYRASFNFLQYPRVALSLRHPYGPVQDLSFSTRQPERILQVLQTLAPPDRWITPRKNAGRRKNHV